MPFRFVERFQGSLKGKSGDERDALQELRDLQLEAWLDMLDVSMEDYTPTTTNVTGGTPNGNFIQIGKLCVFSVELGTGATATAAGVLTIGLPPDRTAIARVQPCVGMNAATSVSARLLSAGTAVTVYADLVGANFVLGAGVASVRVQGAVLVQ